MSCSKRFRSNILIWGVPKHFTKLKVRTNFVELGLESFVGTVKSFGKAIT